MIDPASPLHPLKPLTATGPKPLRRRQTADLAMGGEQVQVATPRPDPKALAQALRDATIGQRGTNETTVLQVLGKLRSPADAKQLDQALQALCGRSVEDVLASELSGTQLSRAQDLFRHQTINWGAHSALAYRAEGALTALDDLGTAVKDRPLMTAAVVGAGLLVSMRAPALMSSLTLAGTAWSAGQVIRSEGQAWAATDPAQRAQRQIQAGTAWGNLALNLPGTRGDIRRVRTAFQAARTATKAEGAVAGLRAFTDEGRTLGRLRLKPAPLSKKVTTAAPASETSLKATLKKLETSNDASAVLAKDMLESYKKLTPAERTKTLTDAFEHLSPAAKKRSVETLTKLAKERAQDDSLRRFVESGPFLLASDDVKLKLLAKWAAKDPEQIATSLLVAMGTGHVKLGQIVADAPFMPESFSQALKQLQKDAPPMPDKQVAEMMAASGMDQKYEVGKLLGVGSVGEVHLGTDKQTGAQVVIKLLKPGVTPSEIKQEFAFMEAYLKPYLDNVHPEKARYLRDNLTNFRDGIIAEIDFGTEMANIEKFAKTYPANANFRGIEALGVSADETVLVMKPAQGIDFKKLTSLTPEQRSDAASKYAHAVYEQVFGEKHYFHADPHPGNVKFDTETGKVVFMDLGATASIADADMHELYRALGCLVARDAKGLANLYVDNAANISSTLSKPQLRAALQQDIQALFDKPGYSASYMIESVKDINDIATKHGVWPKSGNTWLSKTMFTATNVFYGIDASGGNLSSISMPYVLKGLASAYRKDPKAWQSTFFQVAVTLGKSPATVAKSILEMKRLNPNLVGVVPQAMWTSLKAIAISGGLSGQSVPGAAAPADQPAAPAIH